MNRLTSADPVSVALNFHDHANSFDDPEADNSILQSNVRQSYHEGNSYICQIPMNFKEFAERNNKVNTFNKTSNQNFFQSYNGLKIELEQDSEKNLSDNNKFEKNTQMNTPIFNNNGNVNHGETLRIAKNTSLPGVKSNEETYLKLIDLAAK